MAEPICMALIVMKLDGISAKLRSASRLPPISSASQASTKIRAPGTRLTTQMPPVSSSTTALTRPTMDISCRASCTSINRVARVASAARPAHTRR
ncbi:hypothetical protein D3C86_1906450 [compost metagenome]